MTRQGQEVRRATLENLCQRLIAFVGKKVHEFECGHWLPPVGRLYPMTPQFLHWLLEDASCSSVVMRARRLVGALEALQFHHDEPVVLECKQVFWRGGILKTVPNPPHANGKPVQSAVASVSPPAFKRISLTVLPVVSRSWVDQHLTLLKLDDKVFRALDPHVPEDQRLIFTIALLLAKVPHAQQKELLPQVRGNKIRYQQAKVIIENVANAHGIKIRHLKRTPNRDLNMVVGFLERTQGMIEVLFGQTQDFFDNAFGSRNPDYLADILTKMDRTSEDWKVLRSSIAKAKAKADERAKAPVG
jgi:hypothetical protein